MQVSFACSEHGLKTRSAEDRLNRQNVSSPSLAARTKFRAVAMVARSLGHLSVQNVPSPSEASLRQPGMKYRYGTGRRGDRTVTLPIHSYICVRLSAAALVGYPRSSCMLSSGFGTTSSFK